MLDKKKINYGAAKLKLQLNRIGNWANLISLAISLFSAAVSIYLTTKSAIEDKYLILTAIYSITLLSLFLYMFMYLFVHKRLNGNYLKVSAMYLEATEKLNSGSASFRKNLTSHRELNGVVERFLAAIFNYMQNDNSSPQLKAENAKILGTATNEFYTGICDCAVNHVSALKNGHTDSFRSNLKIFQSASTAGRQKYKTVGRSRNTVTTQPERPFTDDRANEGYIVQKNGIYSKLIIEDNHKRKISIHDIGEKISTWAKESGQGYTEPTHGACDFYKNCCCVLIYGAIYTADNIFSNDDFVRLNGEKFAIGVLTVDSMDFQFDASKDCDFLQELCETVFQMIKLKNLIQNMN